METNEYVVTREELIAQGCTEKRNYKRVAYFMKDDVMVAKKCTRCSEIRLVVGFSTQKNGFAKLNPACRECAKVRNRKNNKDNKERYKEIHKKWNEANRERRAETIRMWREKNKRRQRENINRWRVANPDKVSLYAQKRRARKESLPDTLTTSLWVKVLERFNGGCALTGSTDYIQEHVIPLAVGHGGTTVENMSPMRADLNGSKGDRHIFEWFEDNRERFNLSQRKFDELISYLAEVNEMSTKEYRMYVDWCHDNPRSIEDIGKGGRQHVG